MALDKDKICQASLDIVNTEGLEALSMRRLAKALDVKAASLYNHIRNKDDLYDLMQAQLYASKPHLSFAGHWRDHLKALACATYEGLLKNPKMLPLFATRPVLSAQALKQADETIGGLIENGFTADEAMEIFHNMHAYVLGFVLAEVGEPPKTDNSYEEPTISNIDLQEYPSLQKVKPLGTMPSRANIFLQGLQCFLNGIQTTYAIKEV